MNEKTDKKHIHLNTDPENMSVHMLISDISRITRCYAKAESDGLNLTQSCRNILFFLCHEEGLTQLDLSKLTHLKPPTISVTLRKMEEEGYVIRKEDKDDHRQTRVFVTEKGRAFDDRIKSVYELHNKSIVDALTPEEGKILKELLIKARNAVLENRGKKPVDN